MNFKMIFPLLLLLGSCSIDEFQERQVLRDLEIERQHNLAEIDVDKCAVEGGDIDYRGMFGMPMCVIPFEDAGKACTDSSECQGICMVDADGGTPDNPSEYKRAMSGEGPIVGSCEPDDKTFGCFGEVINGKIASAICVD
ncbi:MAG: hypothetical protein EP340_11400 [Alphaproteobacteria bacterium]|nr:MAG: hypothetical protein EP340_11400 [Alphaproteobacteria bacterium]